MFQTAKRAFSLVPVLCICACYSFSGGGGFPQHVRTLFIAPFENKTVKFELDTQIQRELSDKLPRALGVRQGGEKTADAVIRGEIVAYEDRAQNYRPGQSGTVTVIQHDVTITVNVRVIDVKNNRYIWEGNSLTGQGQYKPDTETDEAARKRAIQNVIQRIIDGAQSQW
ncbi:MAG: LptE family protein [Longimicrobiales bacterium]